MSGTTSGANLHLQFIKQLEDPWEEVLITVNFCTQFSKHHFHTYNESTVVKNNTGFNKQGARV
jgi:hypothetical protein